MYMSVGSGGYTCDAMRVDVHTYLDIGIYIYIYICMYAHVHGYRYRCIHEFVCIDVDIERGMIWV